MSPELQQSQDVTDQDTRVFACGDSGVEDFLQCLTLRIRKLLALKDFSQQSLLLGSYFLRFNTVFSLHFTFNTSLHLFHPES